MAATEREQVRSSNPAIAPPMPHTRCFAERSMRGNASRGGMVVEPPNRVPEIACAISGGHGRCPSIAEARDSSAGMPPAPALARGGPGRPLAERWGSTGARFASLSAQGRRGDLLTRFGSFQIIRRAIWDPSLPLKRSNAGIAWSLSAGHASSHFPQAPV